MSVHTKLIAKSIDMANQKFVPHCESISGTIGSLRVSVIEQDASVVFPIDALVLDLTKDDAEGVDLTADTIVDA